MPLTRVLPDFPWDQLVPYGEIAREHPGGLVDLSVGTPVDPTPDVVREALTAASNAPGYPLTAGSSVVQGALDGWARRTLGAVGEFGVLPTIGSKELVAWLPSLLGFGPGHTVVIPEIAYPTYDVGARIAGCRVVACDDFTVLALDSLEMIWLNSPSNPTGKVIDPTRLFDIVDWARDRGAIIVSDECYLELGWDAEPVSIMKVCGGDYTDVLSVHSLSKRSNLAGYRFGAVMGDPDLVAKLLEIRKHAGMIVPAPVQAAAAAALGDDAHVEEQRARYGARREILRAALEGAGFRIDHSNAGLYLWATRGQRCWETVEWLAQRGILVAPGIFYGSRGEQHVRVALTATDERISAAAERLGA